MTPAHGSIMVLVQVRISLVRKLKNKTEKEKDKTLKLPALPSSQLGPYNS
jgi:hypothetical protein